MIVTDGWNFTGIKLNKNIAESLFRYCGVEYRGSKGSSAGAYTMQNIQHIKRK